MYRVSPVSFETQKSASGLSSFPPFSTHRPPALLLRPGLRPPCAGPGARPAALTLRARVVRRRRPPLAGPKCPLQALSRRCVPFWVPVSHSSRSAPNLRLLVYDDAPPAYDLLHLAVTHHDALQVRHSRTHLIKAEEQRSRVGGLEANGRDTERGPLDVGLWLTLCPHADLPVGPRPRAGRHSRGQGHTIRQVRHTHATPIPPLPTRDAHAHTP